jgi:peptidoglycan/LPS O-acetylase OafA/YrhL
MSITVALVVAALAGFIVWEFTETPRLNWRAKRHRERQNAATDRGELYREQVKK